MKKDANSNQKVDLQFVKENFSHTDEVISLIDDEKTVYSRRNALKGIFKNCSFAFLAFSFFIIFGFLTFWLENHLNWEVGDSILTDLVMVFLGLPALLVVFVSLSKSFDLSYLLISGKRLEKDDKEIQMAKTLMLVALFFMFVFGTIFGYTRLSQTLENFKEEEKSGQQQAEFLSYLDKGRAAWNEYISRTPQNGISFRGLDLSQREFNGFFFTSVDFSEADLKKTVFQDCHLGYARFRQANCEKTVFKSCYLANAKFYETDLTKAIFTDSFADKNDFFKAQISQEQLKTILPPKESRWHGVYWYHFRDPAWLKEKGYSFVEGYTRLSF
jgi:uncharacterized protein YjbI with pentapeptide repeats